MDFELINQLSYDQIDDIYNSYINGSGDTIATFLCTYIVCDGGTISRRYCRESPSVERCSTSSGSMYKVGNSGYRCTSGHIYYVCGTGGCGTFYTDSCTE